jgi:hypothetical protein
MQVMVATLDACVLFQGRLTDLLLNLAEADTFPPCYCRERAPGCALYTHLARDNSAKNPG